MHCDVSGHRLQVSRDIDDTPGLRTGGVLFFRLVVAAGVDVEFREDFSGAVFNGGDVVVAGEEDDAFAFMGASDAEMVEPSGVVQCDLAVVVHAVGADPPVFALGCNGGGGFGGLGVGLGRCAAVQGPVGAFVAANVLELGQLFVELLEGVRAGLAGEPFFQGLVEAFDFALGLWVVREPFFCVMPRAAIRFSKAFRPPFPPARRVV